MRLWPLRDKTLVPHARALSGEDETFRLFGQAGVFDLPSLAGTGAPGAARHVAPQSSLRVRP
jgi:hypothetical protein